MTDLNSKILMQTTYVPDLKALPYQKPENSSFQQFFNRVKV